jgi:hypothetical protein
VCGNLPLVGIDAVPVDVIVEGDHVKVVAATNRPILHSARLPAPGAEARLIDSSVKGPPLERAPATLIATPYWVAYW